MTARNQSPVRRITIDERVSEEFVRLLIAPLAEGLKDFTDKDQDWGPEQEIWVSQRTYARRMGTRKQDLSWQGLQEGQVFLSGQFKLVGSEEELQGFQVKPGANKFLRIDQFPLVRRKIKKLYADLVRGEGIQDDA
jgi:hypothetical protein